MSAQFIKNHSIYKDGKTREMSRWVLSAIIFWGPAFSSNFFESSTSMSEAVSSLWIFWRKLSMTSFKYVSLAIFPSLLTSAWQTRFVLFMLFIVVILQLWHVMAQSSLFEIRSRVVAGHAGQHLFPCICGEVKLTSPMTSISDMTDHSLVLMYLLLHISGWLVTFAAWIFSIASSRITSFMDSVSSAARQCVLYNFGLFIAYYRVLVFRLANNFDFEVHRLKYIGCKAIFPWVELRFECDSLW